VDRLSSVRTFTRLFDALATPDNGVAREEGADGWGAMVEMWFLFSLIWGLGGTLDQDGRKRFDSFMRCGVWVGGGGRAAGSVEWWMWAHACVLERAGSCLAAKSADLQG
jgi:hypothetical protein